MFARFALFSACILVAFQARAADYKDFCSKVPTWQSGSDVPPDAEYASLVQAVVDAKKAAEMQKDPTVVLIDARSKEDRKAGTIPNTAWVISDPKDAKKHAFSDEKTVVEKLNKKFKTSHAKVADFKDRKVILFCNGKKCHRSTWAACTLRDQGFPKESLFLMLGGFGDWKEQGLPVK